MNKKIRSRIIFAISVLICMTLIFCSLIILYPEDGRTLVIIIFASIFLVLGLWNVIDKNRKKKLQHASPLPVSHRNEGEQAERASNEQSEEREGVARDFK